MIIVALHAAALAAVMTAKMDIPAAFRPTVTKIDLLPEPKAPPENRQPEPKAAPPRSSIDQVPPVADLPRPSLPPIDSVPLPFPDSGPIVGPGTEPRADPQPMLAPVRAGPRFATPEHLVKPPYPQQKLRMEEEAALRLRLTIDERGRVTAVEPVGRADAVFLDAARRHIIARWRYDPATEGGRPVPSSTVVTLTFRLDG
jgi:protein TonB